MRRILFLSFFIASLPGHAQRITAHIATGIANYVGDIQQQRFHFGQANFELTVGGAYKISDNLSLRGDFTVTKLGGDDKKSNTTRNVRRNLNFKTNLSEFAITAAYDIYTFSDQLTPFLFAGLGLFHFNPYTYDSTNTKVYLRDLGTEGQGIAGYDKKYSLTQLNIPFGGGLRYKINEQASLNFEISIRKLFTDYVDDVSKFYVDRDVLLKERGPLAVELAFRGDEVAPYTAKYPKAGTLRGKDDKDWYYFTQLRFSYQLPFSKKSMK